MQKFFLFISLFFVFNNITAQKLSNSQYELIETSSMRSTSQKTFENQYPDIKGSPYFNDEWLNGEIWKANGHKYQNLRLKVDLYRNIIFMNIHDTVYDMTDIADVVYFIVHPDMNDTSKKIFFSKTFSAPELKNNLIQTLSTGKISLLKKENYTISETATGITNYRERSFTDKIIYYILNGSTLFEIKKLNKKNFETLNLNTSKIEAFAKDNNLSYSDESGWIKMIDYYNSTQ